MLVYYVYVLKINDEYYIGYAENLKRRFNEHKVNREVYLKYFEAYSSKKLATNRKKIKIM